MIGMDGLKRRRKTEVVVTGGRNGNLKNAIGASCVRVLKALTLLLISLSRPLDIPKVLSHVFD